MNPGWTLFYPADRNLWNFYSTEILSDLFWVTLSRKMEINGFS